MGFCLNLFVTLGKCRQTVLNRDFPELVFGILYLILMDELN